MHNPVTGSGGILAGLGPRGRRGIPRPATDRRAGRHAGLADHTPLRLEAVGELDPRSPHVPVTGTAYLASAVPWTRIPTDIPLDAALAAIDVCNAASQTR